MSDFILKAEILLNAESYVSSTKAATRATNEVTNALGKEEKALGGAAKALADYKKKNLELAIANMPGPFDAVTRKIESTAARARAVSKQQAADFNKLVNDFEIGKFDDKLASTRYALYDIGNRAAAFGAAITTAMAAGVQSAIQFESAFTSVERTTRLTGTGAAELKAALIDLSTSIPVAFKDVTQIATLGAQLGIANDQVAEFTETVSKFATITGLSVEEVSLSFGRLSQLLDVPASKFENLSSAVAFAGINAVATDSEILKMSESIAAAANQAGFAADETIGFATALASLKVRPEEARGVLTRLFREFDLSVAEGGARLDDLSRVLGKTSEQTAEFWNQNPSDFVQAFLRGASATGKLNEVITALGITNSRELNVITRLAGNMNVLTSSISDAKEQFAEGTYSSEAYGKVADDLASKLTILQNAIAEMGAELGGTVTGPLGFFVEEITKLVKGISDLPGPVKTFIALVTALTAGLAILFSSLAFGIAGLLAMRLAFTNLADQGIKAGISMQTFRALLISMIPSAGGATTVLGALNAQARATQLSFAGLTFSARTLTAALGIIGVAVTVASTAMTMFEEQENKFAKLGQSMIEAAGGAEALKEALRADAEAGTSYGNLSVQVKDLTEEQKLAKKASLEEAVARAEARKKTEGGEEAYKAAMSALDDFNEKIEAGTGLIQTNTTALGDNTKEFIVNALSKKDDKGQNFFTQLASLDPATKAELERVGFDASKMIEAGLAKPGGALDYIKNIIKKVNPSSIGAKDLTTILNVQGTTNDFFDAATQIDATTSEISTLITVSNGIGPAISDGMDDGTEATIDLNEELRKTVNLLTAGLISENNVTAALSTFAAGAKETGGELDGMGIAARENLSNFASFLDAATEASITAGEGTAGAVRRIIGGLNALGAEGVDTSDAFKVAKTVIVNSISETIGADKALKAQLNATTNLEGIRQAIRAFYAVKIAAATSGEDVRNFTKGLQAALGTLDGTDYQIDPVVNTTKAKTALEKLQDIIKKTFSKLNSEMAVKDSFSNLGKSIEENGKSFSKFTEAGRSNLNALQDVIDDLANSSNGDLKVFANSLASMRKALADSGAGADALAQIDKVIKSIGVKGKASAADVKAFKDALKQVGNTERSIIRVDKAIKNIASSIREGLGARFSQGNAIDALSLAWLDVSDAAQQAQDDIDDATTSIRDARLEIDKTNASIAELAADKGRLEYQLGVALKYGDTIRANEIRAEIAAIDADVAEKQASIQDANQQISAANAQIAQAQGVLGNGATLRQQIEQKQTLQDIALLYADVAAGMIANAKPGEDLNAIVAAQVLAFKENAKQLGFTDEQIGLVSTALNEELAVAIKNVPKDISITANVVTDPALKNVKSLVTQANLALAGIKDKIVTVTTVYQSTGGSALSVVKKASGGLVSGPGTGTSDSIAARLSNGEYVIKASAVQHYGVDFFNALNQMQTPSAALRPMQVASSGSSTVYLSTEDRQLLRAAIDRPIALYTDNATIAQSANDGNKLLAQRGIR